jgi:hypothetical protein
MTKMRAVVAGCGLGQNGMPHRVRQPKSERYATPCSSTQ